jgi:hypothetical protein
VDSHNYLIFDWRDNKMPFWDNYGHRHYDNGRSTNEGIESILRNLDMGTNVFVGTECRRWYYVEFLNYDPEEDLAFFSTPPIG